MLYSLNEIYEGMFFMDMSFRSRSDVDLQVDAKATCHPSDNCAYATTTRSLPLLAMSSLLCTYIVHYVLEYMLRQHMLHVAIQNKENINAHHKNFFNPAKSVRCLANKSPTSHGYMWK